MCDPTHFTINTLESAESRTVTNPSRYYLELLSAIDNSQSAFGAATLKLSSVQVPSIA